MKTLAFSIALVLAAAPAALAAEPLKADQAQAVMTIATPDFTKTVTSSNQFEIRSSQMAEKKAEAKDVKDFGAQMIKDHEKASADLKAAADKGNASLPTEAALAPKHEAMLSQLEAANGPEFQTLYIDMQAQAHREAVALFRTYAGSGDNEAVVAFAKATLPVLEMHQMHVMELVKAH